MEKKIIRFRIKDERFAFDIMRVVEIIRIKDITEVPTAPDFIEGVINLRGKIIPIIDLRKRFKVEFTQRDKNYRIIICEFMSNQLVGVIVDEVEKVTNINPDEILPAPSNISGIGVRYIESVVKQNDDITVLLDVEKIFTEDEQNELLDIADSQEGRREESPDS